MTKLKTTKGPVRIRSRSGGHPDVPLKPLSAYQKRAALYLRVSSEEQTVENQRPELEQLARARGLDVVELYEENVSAVKHRPAFARMLEDAHRGRFDVLIIWAIDRFGRSLSGNLDDVMKLDARGVRIVSARESWLEMDGPARSLLVCVFSWVAEQERRRLSERTRAGMERARANGLHIGRPRAALNVAVLRELLSRDGATHELVAGELGVSVSSIQRALRRDRRQPLFQPRRESTPPADVHPKEVAGRRATAPGRGPRPKESRT